MQQQLEVRFKARSTPRKWVLGCAADTPDNFIMSFCLMSNRNDLTSREMDTNKATKLQLTRFLPKFDFCNCVRSTGSNKLSMENLHSYHDALFTMHIVSMQNENF